MLWEGLDVGSVNQTAAVILLQQIAEELPVEVLNLSSTNYTFPMPKILMFFGSICKYLKNLTLLSVVYPSSDSLGQVPSASRDRSPLVWLCLSVLIIPLLVELGTKNI